MINFKLIFFLQKKFESVFLFNLILQLEVSIWTLSFLSRGCWNSAGHSSCDSSSALAHVGSIYTTAGSQTSRFQKVVLVRDPGWRGRPWSRSESRILAFSHVHKNPGTRPVNRTSFPRRQGLISPSLLPLTSTFLFITAFLLPGVLKNPTTLLSSSGT